MRVNVALIDSRVRRLVSGAQTLGDIARDREDIYPSETTPARPAVYPEGAIDRIIGLSPWTDWPSVRAQLGGAPVRHAATEAFHLRDAVIAGPFLYHGAFRLRIGAGTSRVLVPGLPQRSEIERAHLVSTWTGADFFGSFMRDTLTLERIVDHGARRVGAPVKTYRHAMGYRDLMLQAEPEYVGHARIRDLTVYRDFGQNGFKRSRYRALRQQLRQSLAGLAGPPRPGVFLKRGTDGEPRRLSNEDALIDLLDRHGFDILDCGSLSAFEIARRALDCRVVVAVEGSHLAHGAYTVADGGAFLVIQPPNRFALPYKEFADSLDLRFGFVVGEPEVGGFSVNLDEIRDMLDRLLS